MKKEITLFAMKLFGHVEKKLQEVDHKIASFGDRIRHAKNVTIHDIR